MTELAWHQDGNGGSLEAFLERYPPSKTYAPKGGDGWIWVTSSRERDVESGSSKSIEEARQILDDLVQRYDEIEVNRFVGANSSNVLYLMQVFCLNDRIIQRYPRSRARHLDQARKC